METLWRGHNRLASGQLVVFDIHLKLDPVPLILFVNGPKICFCERKEDWLRYI